MQTSSDSRENLTYIQVIQSNLMSAKVRRYCVVKFCTGLATPSLRPLDSIESTV
jgi:hypothetical protein